MEQLGYVKALDGAPLYAAYHAAAPGQPERALPLVIVPPLFEERKSAYAPLRRLALRLAGAGHAVLRFDYRGSGESGGDGNRRRWQHLAEDVAVARKTLARLAGKRDAALLGLRLGATLALQGTIRAGGEAVIALAPVVNGAAQVRLWKMRATIRAELTGEPPGPNAAAAAADDSALDFDGYDVHPAFFEDVAAINLPRDLGALSCPGRIVQVSHRTEPAAENTELLKTLGSRAKLDCLRLEPFWDKLDDVDTAPLEERILKALSEF